MDNTRNALAELAERLGEITSAWRPLEPTGQYATQSISYVRKAQRIVAELAKVQFTKNGDAISCYEANVIVNKCLAIAKEGELK